MLLTDDSLVTPPDGVRVGAAIQVLLNRGAGTSLRLINLCARTQVGTGPGALIAGFVVDGTLPKRLLLRTAGPTLTAFGGNGTLAGPVHTLRPLGSDTIVATNHDWAGAAGLVSSLPWERRSRNFYVVSPWRYR